MGAVLEIPLPAGLSEKQLRAIREEVALLLNRQGYYSAREAADWLGLAEGEFVELAAERARAHARKVGERANARAARAVRWHG